MNALVWIVVLLLAVVSGVAVLAVLLRRKLPASWASWWWGGLAWIASQVLRMPLLIGLTALFSRIGPSPDAVDPAQVFWINLVILAGTSGPFEEIARYVVLKTAAKRTRDWREAVMFGAGHGGIEAVLLIGFAALQSIVLVLTADQVLTQLGALPVEQQALVRGQIDAARAAGPETLIGALERAFAICLHVGLGVMVTRAVVHNKRAWLLIAIVVHIAANALTVIAQRFGGVWAAEATIAVIALAALVWVIRVRPRFGPAERDANA
jgi:uncharacterized membrane protein YhfC